jgi:SpoVK/Ycf46/Vps4 family AAA+-type ATPase
MCWVLLLWHGHLQLAVRRGLPAAAGSVPANRPLLPIIHTVSLLPLYSPLACACGPAALLPYITLLTTSPLPLAPQVLTIGATNLAQDLDQALLRPGRFEVVYEIPAPGPVARMEILRYHSRNKQLDSDAMLKRVAEVTQGWSAASLANLMNEAAIMTVGGPAGAGAGAIEMDVAMCVSLQQGVCEL